MTEASVPKGEPDTSPRQADGDAGLRIVILGAALLLGVQGALLLQPLLGGHSWFTGSDGLPAAADFVAYRVAGNLALEGQAAAAYDWPHFRTRLVAFLGRDLTHWLGWLNPPTFLLVVTPLALLPYTVAAFVWLGATGAAYLAAARAALPRPGVALLALAAPAVFACVLKGQNGLLSAALIGFGVVLLDRRPVVAGLCFGALAYKPHLGLVLPLLLLADRRWRTIAAAAATLAMLALLTLLAFGPAPWIAFFGTMAGTAERFLVQGAGMPAMQSVYGLAAPRLGPAGGMAVHVAVAVAAFTACLMPWRRGMAAEGARGAATIAASFLATPYAFEHDAPMLVIAALLLARGQGNQRLGWPEGAALCLAVLLPGATLFTATNLPGPVAAAITLVVARRQASRAVAG